MSTFQALPPDSASAMRARVRDEPTPLLVAERAPRDVRVVPSGGLPTVELDVTR